MSKVNICEQSSFEFIRLIFESSLNIKYSLFVNQMNINIFANEFVYVHIYINLIILYKIYLIIFSI